MAITRTSSYKSTQSVQEMEVSALIYNPFDAKISFEFLHCFTETHQFWQSFYMDETRMFKLRRGSGERYPASPKSQPYDRRFNQLVPFSLAMQKKKPGNYINEVP